MMKEKFTQGDVYKWRFNEKKLNTEHMKLQMQAGTLYWCCSRIGIVNNEGLLEDTYWGASGENKRFNIDYCREWLDLDFLGNINEFELRPERERGYYNDSDCMNLNHANSSNGNFYVRKSAYKSLLKMKRILNREINSILCKIDSLNRDLLTVERDLEEINIDSQLFVGSDISLADEYYTDIIEARGES